MSRFERRQNKTSQPMGSVYSRNNISNKSQSIPNQQMQQCIVLLQKHDELLSKLLARFNDMDSTLNSKVESIIDQRLADLSTNIDIKFESLREQYNLESNNPVVNAVVENVMNDIEKNDKERSFKENFNRDFNDLKQEIINEISDLDVLKQTEYASGIFELKKIMGDMFGEIINKQAELFNRNADQMTGILQSLQAEDEYKELKKEFETEKEDLFYEKDVNSNKITKEVKIELSENDSVKNDENNIELEIVEQ